VTRVSIPPLAKAGIEGVGDHIAQDNPLRAVSFVVELRAVCMSFGDMPLAFLPLPGHEHEGVRHYRYGNYRVFYRVFGDPFERVSVLRVLHVRRGFAALLS
jgi:plasmid stabilization system protein ParE